MADGTQQNRPMERAERNSPWRPFRRPTFRALWLATVVSNVEWWMQSVGAAWLMTSLTSSPMLIAMVQGAASLLGFCCTFRHTWACTLGAAVRGRLPLCRASKPSTPKLFEPLLPARNRWCGRLQTLLDRTIRQAVSQRQYQTCSKNISRRQAARLRPTLQFFTLLCGERKQLSISCHIGKTRSLIQR